MIQKVSAFTCEKFPYCFFFFHFQPAVGIFLLSLLHLYKLMPRFILLIEEERKPLTVTSASSDLMKRICDLFAQVKSLAACISDPSSGKLKIPLRRLKTP